MAQVKNVIMIAVGLMVVAVIIPIAIGLISNAGNTVINATAGTKLSDVADPSIITLLTVLLPIISVIGIVLGFLKWGKD